MTFQTRSLGSLPLVPQPADADYLAGVGADGRGVRHPVSALGTYARQALGVPGRPAREGGVVPNTAEDQTAKLAALMERVRADGGGKILLEPGVYSVHDLAPVSGVLLEGVRGATRLQAPAGSGGRVITNPGFAAMVGTDDFNGEAPHGFGFAHLVLDGNAGAQSVTGAARDLACPYQVYGFNFFLHGLRIEGAAGHALRSEWGRYGDFAMQSYVSEIETDWTPRHGIWWNGPHDSVLSDIFPVDSGVEGDKLYCGIQTGPNGGSHWNRVHVWKRSWNGARTRCAFASAGGSIVTDADLEGGATLFEAGGRDRLGGLFYASFGDPGGCMIDVLGNLVTVDAGTRLENATNADIYAIRLGRAAAKVSGFVYVGGLIGGFPRGAVDFSGDAGGNRIQATGYGNGAPTGMADATIVDFDFNTPTVRILRGQLDPGPYGGAAAAKAAGLRFGDRFLHTDGTVRWVNV